MSLTNVLKSVSGFFTAPHPDVPRHRIQLLVVMCWIATLAGVLSVASAEGAQIYGLGLFTVSVAVLPFALRARVPIVLVQGSAVGIATVFLLYMAHAEGEVIYRHLYWYCILPLTAGLLMGRVGLWAGGAIGLACVVGSMSVQHGWEAIAGDHAGITLDAMVFVAAVSVLTAAYVRLQTGAQEGLKRALHARSTFVAQMSHELRTPMNGVLGMVDVLQADPEQDVEQALEIIARSGRNMVELIDELLDHAKLDAGRLQISVGPCRPDRLAQDVTLLVRPSLKAGVRLRLEGTETLPSVVQTDGLRLRQILQNLLSNAAKFTEVGQVVVRMSWSEDRLYVDVEDSGIGLTSEQQSRLFKPFEQARAETAAHYGGTGLGLAISRSLCRLMGGDLTVCAEIGQGSVFSFSVQAPQAELAPPSQAPSAFLGVLSGRVLLVEDNLVNQVVGRRLCELLGLDVVVEGNGAQAIARLQRDSAFDAVLMDCQMPVLDGWQATRTIRESAASYAGIPIIAVTASVVSDDRERCLQAGMDDVVSKPLDRPTLSAALVRHAPSVGQPRRARAS